MTKRKQQFCNSSCGQACQHSSKWLQKEDISMFMPPEMILPLTILKSAFVPKAVTRIALCSLVLCTASASSETGSKHVENTWMFSACFLVDRCVGQSYLMSGLSSIQPLTTQKTSDVCSGFAGFAVPGWIWWAHQSHLLGPIYAAKCIRSKFDVHQRHKVGCSCPAYCRRTLFCS